MTLYKARELNEARYNIIKANKDAAESEELEVKRKALCVDAAPAYWKRRIEEGKELTKVVFLQTSTTRRHALYKAVFEHVTSDETFLSELFIQMMEYMVPSWEEERSKGV